MSAGLSLPHHGTRPERRLSLLAPRFREAVEAAIAECVGQGLEATVYETWRSAELQALYWARGRTVRPPLRPVTNARDHLESWHGYGLAVDVIHARRGWGAPVAWFAEVARVFARHGCRWGGEWRVPDYPHFQWGRCKPSPSDRARALHAEGGLEAVWRAVGAWEEPPVGQPIIPGVS